MTVWHKTLQHRFAEFTPEQQILMVCNELNRAQNNQSDSREYKNCLERAMELIDLILRPALGASRLRELLRGRELIAGAYLSQPAPTAALQRILLQLNPRAWAMGSGKALRERR